MKSGTVVAGGGGVVAAGGGKAVTDREVAGGQWGGVEVQPSTSVTLPAAAINVSVPGE